VEREMMVVVVVVAVVRGGGGGGETVCVCFFFIRGEIKMGEGLTGKGYIWSAILPKYPCVFFFN